jgi:hypothetical protein
LSSASARRLSDAGNGPSEFLSKPFTIIGDSSRADLLLSAGSLRFEEARAARLERDVEGVRIPCAGLDALIRSTSTDRLRDQADLDELRLIKECQDRPDRPR